MAVLAKSIASGKCYAVSGEAGGVRRVVKLEHGELTYQVRGRQAAPARWGASVTASADIFAAEVDREVPCDFDKAS
jgi:hypothetical protein